MKIALLGSHGVGKTTLCFDLAARLKRLDQDVDIVREVARRCPLPLNQQTTLAAQRWILHQQIADEIGAEAHASVVLCDRSILDNYAYLTARFGAQPELEALVAEWVKTYDGLFKVPILQAPRFDGTRDTSEDFQAEIDRRIDQLLVHFGARCTDLDPALRARWPQEILKSAGFPENPAQFGLFDGAG